MTRTEAINKIQKRIEEPNNIWAEGLRLLGWAIENATDESLIEFSEWQEGMTDEKFEEELSKGVPCNHFESAGNDWEPYSS